jgi:hypothetical protein
LEDAASHFQRQYHRAIRDAKRRHWKEFLDNTDNIWKAAQYLGPGKRSFGRIPTLKTDYQIFDNNQEKSWVLLEVFFPPLPDIRKEPQPFIQQPESLPMELITPQEIEVALMKMSSWKAPG